MKPSRFNVTIPAGEHRSDLILWNTFTDARLLVDRSVGELLAGLETCTSLPAAAAPVLAALSQVGAIVRDDVNEYLEAHYWLQRARYDSSELRLTVLPTMACNMRCTYCFERDLGRRRHMGSETIEKLLQWTDDSIARMRPASLRVVFFGGEPLLARRSLVALASGFQRLAGRRGCKFSADLITNGLLLSPALVDQLKPLGLDRIKVTLDGDREDHDARRPRADGGGSFNTILRNLVSIRGKVPLWIGVNYDKGNVDGIPALLTRLRAEGLNEHVKSVSCKPILAGPGEEPSPAVSGCRTCTLSDADPEEFLALAATVHEHGFQCEERLALGPCEASLEWSFAVDPEGFLYKCPALAGRIEFAIGKVGERIDHPLNTALMTFEGYRETECRRCAYLPLCFGGCRVAALTSGNGALGRCCEKRYFHSVGREIVRRTTLEQAQQDEPSDIEVAVDPMEQPIHAALA